MPDSSRPRLTRAQVLRLPPGRDLDALVDELVMDHQPGEQCHALKEPRGRSSRHCSSCAYIGPDFPHPRVPPAYSMEIGPAWAVVKRLGSDVEIVGLPLEGWFVILHGSRALPGRGPTVELAICHAALLVAIKTLPLE